MNTDNKIAKAIGALFIITMLLGMIDAYTVAPLLDLPVQEYHLNQSLFHIGAFSILFMSLGVVGIAILFFPILEKHSRLVAISYVSARVMECLLLIIGVVVYFILLTLSQEFTGAGTADASALQSIANLVVKARFVGYQLAMIILGIASMMLCYLLYKIRLIPRIISLVGFLGYALLFISALLDLLGVIDTTGAGGLLYVPGTLFELLLLPGWLIVKGFNRETTAR